MRNVRNELTLAIDQLLGPVCHAIEVFDEAANFIAAFFHPGACPCFQISFRQLPGSGAQSEDWSGDIASEEITDASGNQESDEPVHKEHAHVRANSGARTGREIRSKNVGVMTAFEPKRGADKPVTHVELRIGS